MMISLDIPDCSGEINLLGLRLSINSFAWTYEPILSEGDELFVSREVIGESYTGRSVIAECPAWFHIPEQTKGSVTIVSYRDNEKLKWLGRIWEAISGRKTCVRRELAADILIGPTRENEKKVEMILIPPITITDTIEKKGSRP